MCVLSRYRLAVLKLCYYTVCFPAVDELLNFLPHQFLLPNPQRQPTITMSYDLSIKIKQTQSPDEYSYHYSFSLRYIPFVCWSVNPFDEQDKVLESSNSPALQMRDMISIFRSQSKQFKNGLKIFQDLIIIKPINTYFMSPHSQPPTTASCMERNIKLTKKNAEMVSQSIVEPQSIKNVYEYQMDELVWGKIIGYPWWPGIICDKKHQIIKQDPEYQYDVIYQICFFGDQTYAYLPANRIYQYSINRDYFIQTASKNKKAWNSDNFTKAVVEADEIASMLRAGGELQSKEEIIDESSLKEEEIATNSSLQSQSLIEIEILQEGQSPKQKGKPQSSKKQSKANSQLKRKLQNSFLQMRQMSILLYKIVKSKAKTQQSDIDLRMLAIELLKLKRFDNKDTNIENVEEKAKQFMLLFQMIKHKTLAQLIDLVPSNANLQRPHPQYQSLQEHHKQPAKGTCNNQFANYIYIDEFGHQFICSDALHEVEIVLQMFQ